VKVVMTSLMRRKSLQHGHYSNRTLEQDIIDREIKESSLRLSEESMQEDSEKSNLERLSARERYRKHAHAHLKGSSLRKSQMERTSFQAQWLRHR
jgi:hypothetical protein